MIYCCNIIDYVYGKATDSHTGENYLIIKQISNDMSIIDEFRCTL